MDKKLKFNVVVIGVSCFDGMASSIRVRNLLEASTFEESLILNNLVYKVDAYGLKKKKGVRNGIYYLVVRASTIFSVFTLTWQGMRFLSKRKSTTQKNIVYHYQYLDIKNIILLLYAKLIGYKIILDIVENNNYYTTFSSFKNRIKIRTSLWFLKLTPLIADQVISISQHLKTFMMKVCKENIPVTLIPITVNFKQFEHQKFKIPQTFKIFYGGSFGVKDGLEYIIKSFGQLSQNHPNIQLVMTGRASKEDEKLLQSYLSKSNAIDKIVHLGFLNDNEYYKTLNECHIFCMTRINSKFANAGFPFKLGEFLSTGKAVVATNVGDVSHYLNHKDNALVIQPESVSELVQALNYLLENPLEIERIGKNGRIVAETHFDSKRWSETLKTIFEKV